MREITSHIVNPVNDKLKITVLDDPGAGGANHEYQIAMPDRHVKGAYRNSLCIYFQNGPINEHGVNGVTQEALLAIVADRLECFQAGPFACNENAVALAATKEAMAALQSRTRARMERGIEGTNQK